VDQIVDEPSASGRRAAGSAQQAGELVELGQAAVQGGWLANQPPNSSRPATKPSGSTLRRMRSPLFGSA